MNNKDIEILIRDLCARLPYKVICDRYNNAYELVDIDIKRGLIYLEKDGVYMAYSLILGDEVKPYLRSVSSMTDEEHKELRQLICCSFSPKDCPIVKEDFSVTLDYTPGIKDEHYVFYGMETMYQYIDWLLEHHFDFHNLIKQGLALEAPEGMYGN